MKPEQAAENVKSDQIVDAEVASHQETAVTKKKVYES